jgi:hypothetical protein
LSAHFASVCPGLRRRFSLLLPLTELPLDLLFVCASILSPVWGSAWGLLVWHKKCLSIYDQKEHPVMTSEEIEIYHYLKSRSGQFANPIEISRHVAKRRCRANPQWALPLLAQMLERGILESNAADAYRISHALLAKIEDDRKKQRWLAPQIRLIFEKCCKDLSRSVTLDDPEIKNLMFL